MIYHTQLLGTATKKDTFVNSEALELVYPFKKIDKRPLALNKGFTAKSNKATPKKPLLQLQEEWYYDHVNRSKLSSFDKYYELYRNGYGLDWEPESISNGLSASLMYVGRDNWRLAQTLANTRLVFSPELAWLTEWVGKYFPETLDYFLELVEQVKSLRSPDDFVFINSRKYSRQLASGGVVRGKNAMYRVEFLTVEVVEIEEDNQAQNERKSPCEHQRKAHIRRVRYGKGRAFTKWVEIPETTVCEGA